MHVTKESIPTVLEVPGATARQIGGFGNLPGVGEMAGEWFTLGAGVDIAPLLTGLEQDSCGAAHWGYLISGSLVITYRDHPDDHVKSGDLFYWPPHHSVRVVDDSEVILFSPLVAHRQVVDHMAAMLGVAS